MKKIILSLAMVSICYTVKAKITLPTLTKIEVKNQSKIDKLTFFAEVKFSSLALIE